MALKSRPEFSSFNEDLIKVQKGDEVKIEKEGNKYYVKTLEGESLSGQNTSGFTGKRNARRFVFSSEADHLRCCGIHQ